MEQSLVPRVSVSVRIAPTPGSQREPIYSLKASNKDICLLDPRSVLIEQNYEFSHVFPPEATQAEVFNLTCRSVVERALEGFNGCYLAYGQRRSGKTFTIFGGTEMEMLGMIEMALQLLIEGMSLEPRLSISIACVDLGQDKIHSLTATGVEAVYPDEIHLQEAGGTFVLPEKHWKPVTSVEGAKTLMKHALKTRNERPPAMNPLPLIHTFVLLRLNRPYSPDTPQAFLAFGDLARSERSRRDSIILDQINYMHINSVHSGFTALVRVLEALARTTKQDLVIPYRESRMTSLLSKSLSGNWTFAMLACLTPFPQMFDECVNVLQYAVKIKGIEDTVAKNAELSRDQENAQLTKRMKLLSTSVTEMKFNLDQMEFLHSKELKKLSQLLGLDFDLELLKFEKADSKEVVTVRNMREAMEKADVLKKRRERLQAKLQSDAVLLSEIKLVITNNQQKQISELNEYQAQLSELANQLKAMQGSGSTQFIRSGMQSLEELQKMLIVSHLSIESKAAELKGMMGIVVEGSDLGELNTIDRKAGRDSLEGQLRLEYKRTEEDLTRLESKLERGYEARLSLQYKQLTALEQEFKRCCHSKIKKLRNWEAECAGLSHIVGKQQNLIEAITRGDFNKGIVPVLVPRSQMPLVPGDLLKK